MLFNSEVNEDMEMDLKKAFYIIVAIALIAIMGSAIAQPVYNKISQQKSQIESVNFTGTSTQP